MEKILDSARIHIASCIAFLGAALYIVLNLLGKVDLLGAKNLSTAFESVLTFISILIGLMSLLFTTIITQKTDSEIIKYFLNTADKQILKNTVVFNVLSGVICAFLSIMLLLNDAITLIAQYLLYGWIYTIIYFLVSTINSISILINLLLSKDKKRSKVKMENPLSEDTITRLDDSLK